MIDFNTILTADKPGRNWSNKEKAQFHYFNPNGLYQQKLVADKEIDRLVEAGLAKTGAYYVYGSLNRFHFENLVRFSDIKRKRVDSIELGLTLRGMRDDIQKALAFVAERRAEAEKSV